MNDVETQLRAEIAQYDPTRDLRYIPHAVARVDEILAHFDNPNVEIRRYVAAGAMYAILGDLPTDKKEAILEKAAASLVIMGNGHLGPVEPDVYVRERCAGVLELAASAGCDISQYITILTSARDHDPYEWVQEKARAALRHYSSLHCAKTDLHRVARIMGQQTPLRDKPTTALRV